MVAWIMAQNTIQKSISIGFCVSAIRHDWWLSKYRKQKQPPLEMHKMAECTFQNSWMNISKLTYITVGLYISKIHCCIVETIFNLPFCTKNIKKIKNLKWSCCHGNTWRTTRACVQCWPIWKYSMLNQCLDSEATIVAHACMYFLVTVW